MAWKERHLSRPVGWVRGLIVLAGAVGAVGVGVEAIRRSIPALVEVRDHGYADDPAWTGARDDLNDFLRTAGASLYGLWALGIATAAAVGVAEEREAETWSSLLVNDLRGVEILQAKTRSAIHAMRGLGIALLLLWTLGLAAGAIHPFGFVLVVLGANTFSRAIAALGTLVSLHAATTTRALARAVPLLFVLNVGYLFCCGGPPFGTPIVLAGCTPLMIGWMSLSYSDVSALLGQDPGHSEFDGEFGRQLLLTLLLSIALHAALAFILRSAALASFDDAAGRPRRPSPL